MIERHHHVSRVVDLLSRFPVVGISGARQVGKSTLAKLVAADRPATFFDLEHPDDRVLLDEPVLALEPLRGLVVLDEVQRVPDLFPYLRVLADRPGTPARFLVLGSASPDLLRQGAESLAGRIAWHELPGFSLDEVGAAALDALWGRGGFPRSFLATSDAASFEWREAFVRTFVERDLPQLGVSMPSHAVHRFWTMLAHYHGQTWNGAEFARAFGVSDHTVRRYLDLLTQALVVRQLQPWHANVAKRQVRSPKVYIADSGLLHALLGLPSLGHLERHPKVGASWEGFVLGQIVARLGVRWDQCSFWGTHAGAELDLFVQAAGRRLGFEVKRTTSPRVSPSMRSALADLELEALTVVYAGTRTVRLADWITALPAARLLDELEPVAS